MQIYKNIFILLIITSFLILCKKEQTSEVGSVPCSIPDLEKSLVENSNQLGFECFRRLSMSNEVTENLIISPLGISLSINALLQASQNRTNTELKNCLHLNNFKDSNIIEGYEHLNRIYSEIDFQSKIVNSSKFAFDEDFVQEPEFDNFYGASKYASIIHDNNAGFIENINEKSPGQNIGHFQMINSFDFNSKSKFQIRVEESPFYRSPNESSFIEMIVSKSQLNYYSDPTVQVIELPLGRGNYNIMVIVPQNSESINDICRKMDKKIIDKIKKKFQSRLLEVMMPKIELTGIKTIKEIFKNKLQSAFKDKIADFSNLSKKDKIFMHDFEHIVNLNISSNGAESTDNSGDSFDGKKEGSVLIDHPFIFLIYEKYSEGILCIGKISNI